MAPPIQAGTLAEYALVPGGRGHRQAGRGLGFVAAAALPLAVAAAVAAVAGHRPAARAGRVRQRRLGGRRLVRHPAADRTRRKRAGHRHRARHRASDRPWGGPRHRLHDRSGRRAGPAPPTPYGVDALIDLVSYTPDGLPLDAVREGGKVASSMGAADDQTLAVVRPDRVKHHGRPGPRGRRTPGRAGRQRHVCRFRSPPNCPSSKPPRAWPSSPKATPTERSSSPSQPDQRHSALPRQASTEIQLLFACAPPSPRADDGAGSHPRKIGTFRSSRI